MSDEVERFPLFATNDPLENQTVDDQVNKLFRVSRVNLNNPPIAIATAYINAGGFSLLADELEAAPRVRILLGAEPQAEVIRSKAIGEAGAHKKLMDAESDYESWLLAERDSMGFTFESVEQAKRLVEWLEKKRPDGQLVVEVRKYAEGFLHGKAYIGDHPAIPAVLAGSSNMTYAGLKLNAELNLGTSGPDGASSNVIHWFNKLWEASEPYDLKAMFSDQWEPHAPAKIFLRMLLELYGNVLKEEERVKTEFDLADFQVDGVSRMRRILDELGGVLVADEVGLGKTFLAGEIIKNATDKLRQRVLIICPASLKKSMWEPFLTKWGFRLTEVMTYEEVRIQVENDEKTFLNKTADYAMVVIDEAHRLRNPATQTAEAVDKVILSGRHPKQVVLLTATPVNNSLMDLDALIRYFIRDDARFAAQNIPSIKRYIQDAQNMDPNALTPEHLFELMDQIAVRRTRKFIKQQYANDMVRNPKGEMVPITFPKPRVRRVDYEMSPKGLELIDGMIYALDTPDEEDTKAQRKARREDPNRLSMARYIPTAYQKSGEIARFQLANAGLLRSALLKRLESSHFALKKTLQTLVNSHVFFLSGLNQGKVVKGRALRDWIASESEELDEFLAGEDNLNPDLVEASSDYHLDALKADVESDLALLRSLLAKTEEALAERDPKFESLVEQLTSIAKDAKKNGNIDLSETDRRKVIIFSSYADTVIDIFERLNQRVVEANVGELANFKNRIPDEPIMGGYRSAMARNKAGGVDLGGRAAIIEGFAPKTAGRKDNDDNPLAEDKFDILITTDVLAEGVNLQQAGQMINYDLPWNPMRIVQRHGRIDRLFSDHEEVFLGLFYPAERLDEMLGLENRLNRKLLLANAAIGAGDVLPGGPSSTEVILHDDRVKSVEGFEELLENRGSSAALSGEEFRRRLFKELSNQRSLLQELKKMSLGVGSGFESPSLKGNYYVFCVRVGEGNQPWFRTVEADAQWNVKQRQDGSSVIHSETLTALMVADPLDPYMSRHVSDEAYIGAFKAWKLAKDAVHSDWTVLTDPHNLLPDLPSAFIDAQDLVLNEGEYLGHEAQAELRAKLQNVPPRRVQLSVRKVLNDNLSSREKIEAIREVLEAAGLQVPDPVNPLPVVNESEVRLVAWMAVKGTRS
jgi:superfamily II DNA/RNA helicase